jgi:mannose-1-phosphate guanylyltransferase
MDLVAGSADLVRGLAPSAALPGPIGQALVLKGADVAADAVLAGGCTVGEDTVVGAGARLDGALVFDGAVIGEGAVVERSVLGAGARVGAGAVLRDAVIGDRAVVGERCELRDGLRLWPGVVLPAGGVRFSADLC